MKKIVIEFCNGEKVEATSAFKARKAVYDFFMSLPATNDEKERYLKEFDEAAKIAFKINSNNIIYDPFIKINILNHTKYWDYTNKDELEDVLVEA